MAVSTEDIKTLRKRTGSGIMDCRRALLKTSGDIDKAVELLRKEGIAKAEQKAARETTEGLISCYIHTGGSLGALVELACETDFVARTDVFKELAADLAMHVAGASPQYLSPEDVDEEVREKEREIYEAQARQEGKPERVIERIAEGKLRKFCEQICLLEQPFVKDEKVKVKELIAEKIALLGENIRVTRFARFRIGEEAKVAGVR